jgi:hypothetical protein
MNERSFRVFLYVAFTCSMLSSRASTIDDSISFKSLVLGSLRSGQNASGRWILFTLRMKYLTTDVSLPAVFLATLATITI